jgi:hypothetical protein
MNLHVWIIFALTARRFAYRQHCNIHIFDAEEGRGTQRDLRRHAKGKQRCRSAALWIFWLKFSLTRYVLFSLCSCALKQTQLAGIARSESRRMCHAALIANPFSGTV